MRKRSLASFVVALVLLSGASAPRAVVSRTFSEGGAAAVVASNLTAAEEAPPKKSGNAFARAITAPFRALARLFGGGKKKKNRPEGSIEAAKKQEKDAGVVETKNAAGANAAPTVDARARVNDANASAEQTQMPAVEETRHAAKKDGSAKARAANADASVAASPAAVERPRAPEPRVRVAEQPAPLYWKPYIENVPMDHLSQGRALLQFGYYNEAIAELSVAATVGPDLVEANNLLGQTYDRIGAHKQARDYYERALSLAPQNPWVLHNLGYSFYLDDQYDAALKRLKQAARLAPLDARIAESTGLVQFKRGKFDEAYKSFARFGGEYVAHFKLAEMLEQSGWNDQAIKHYEAALRARPASFVALERLAALYDRTGRRKQAEALRRTLKDKSHTGGGG